MNSIVYTHLDTPDVSPDALEVALHRLGAWLDAERDTLGSVLAQAGRRGASSVLEALDQLHLEPEATPRDLRELLEEARMRLEVLLETLRGIPCRQGTVSAWGLPGPAAFDTHVRWSAARLQDILATLQHALAA